MAKPAKKSGKSPTSRKAQAPTPVAVEQEPETATEPVATATGDESTEADHEKERGTSPVTEGDEKISEPPIEAGKTGEPAPAPAAEVAKVKVNGSGTFEGSVMSCKLLRADRKTVKVELLGRPVIFGRADGRATRERKGWVGGSWRLDLESVASIPLPPSRARRVASGEKLMILPVAMAAPVVAELDAAWKRHGFGSRISFIRRALGESLRRLGEGAVADKIDRPAGT